MKTMKTLRVVSIGLFLLTGIIPAQEPTQFVAAGAGINSPSVQQATGFAAYGRAIADGTYSYTAVQLVAGKASTVETGIARRMLSQGPLSLFALGTAGAAMGEDNFGAAFSGGGVVSVQLPKRISAGRFVFGAKASKTTITGEVKPTFLFGLSWGF